MVIGKGKTCLKSKILAFLKSAYQKFDENALSQSNFSKEENESPYNPRIQLKQLLF